MTMTMLQSSINEVIQYSTDYSNDLSVRLRGFCNNGAFHYHLEVGFSEFPAEYVIRVICSYVLCVLFGARHFGRRKSV